MKELLLQHGLSGIVILVLGSVVAVLARHIVTQSAARLSDQRKHHEEMQRASDEHAEEMQTVNDARIEDQKKLTEQAMLLVGTMDRLVSPSTTTRKRT